MQHNTTLVKHLILSLFAVFLGLGANAQTYKDIYMRDGSYTVDKDGGVTVRFYDSHGPATASNGTVNYWDYWYNQNEEFTYTFNPKNTGYKIKVAFQTFTCYGWNDDGVTYPYNCQQVDGAWSLRLNDDFLYVYEGTTTNPDNLIAAYTGNSEQAFTVMATGVKSGSLTFRFVSNSQYREEGWYAIVTEEATLTAQPPFIRRSTCDNAVELLPTSLGATMYYTSGSSSPATPTTSSTSYSGPIDFPASGDFYVKAISKVGSLTSSVETAYFTDSDRIPTLAAPTLTRATNGNTVTMTPPEVPAGVNETYIVRYTLSTSGDPADPDLTNSELYTSPVAFTVPGTKIKAKTFGLSCDNWHSTATAEMTIAKIYAPEPVFNFEGASKTITAIENGVSYDILYTTDGSEPSISPMHGVHGYGSINMNEILRLGMTVKALAYVALENDPDFLPNTAQYEASSVLTAIYSGSGSQVSGKVVFLDDREDHSWSYYSDKDQPIHCLKPTDIKISYKGNGEGNMTNSSQNGDEPTTFSADAEGVKVGVAEGEEQDEFIYLKTLENSNPEGSTENNSYLYTTIPNPFQVRPTYTESGPQITPIKPVTIGDFTSQGPSSVLPTNTESAYTLSQQIYTAEEIGRSGELTEISFYALGGLSRNLAVYLKHTAKSSFANTTDWESVSSSDQVFTGTVTTSSSGWYTISFTTPFIYNGSSNLLVCVDDNTTSTASATDFKTYPTHANHALYVSGSSNPSTSSTGTLLQYNDQIRFGFKGNTVIGTTPTTVEYGSGSTSYSNYSPVNIYYNYSISATLYTAAEVGEAGDITSIAYRNSSPYSATRDIYVWLVATTNTELNTTWNSNDWGSVSDSNADFSGTVSFAASDWTTITLDEPFTYDGTSNLVVIVEDRTGSYTSDYPQFYYSSSSAYTLIYARNDDESYASSWPSSSNTTAVARKNQIRFGKSVPTYNTNYVEITDVHMDANLPVTTYRNYSLTQQIYTAKEMQAIFGTTNSGRINSIAFLNSTSNTATRNISVYLKHTSKDSFEDESDWESIDASFRVFTGTVTFAANEWTTITFNQGSRYFEYDGTHNLVVCIDDNTGTGITSDYPYFSVFSVGDTKRTLRYSNNSTNPDESNLGTISGTTDVSRNRIKFAGPSKGEGGETPKGSLDLSATVVDGSSTNYYVPMYTFYCDNGFTSEYIIPASYFTAAGLSNGDQLTSITLYQNASAWVAKNLTVKLLNTSISSYSSAGLLGSSGTEVYTNESYSAASAASHSFYFNTPFTYTGGSLIVQISAASGGDDVSSYWYGVSTSTNQGYYVYSSYTGSLQKFIPKTSFTYTTSGGSSNPWRGFYAWRVKRLSDGLTIKSKDGTITYNTTDNNIIPAETEIQFITDKAYGNEVDFEALWAQAYVNSNTHVSNSGNYQNAYERNFKVGTTITTYNYPVTFSTVNPDGTGTVGSVTTTNYTCANDVKFENMVFTNASGGTFTAAGNNLVFGRGIGGTVNRVQGIANQTGQSNLNYKLRIETGTINYLSMTYGTAETSSDGPTVAGLNRVVGIVGSDYDRANSHHNFTQTNQPLKITTGMSNGCGVKYSDDGNQARETCHVTVKSGYFLQNQTLDNAKEAESYYLSHDGYNNSYCGQRTLIIEGGSLLCVAGGQDDKNDPEKLSLYLRMKGGEVRGAIYGGSAFANMNGDRKMVFTGGNVKGWIAVGSNGRNTTSAGGYLENSDGYLYLGGNTIVNSDGNDNNINTAQGGNVFGAGVGNEAQETTGSIRNTTVVIADNAKIQRNVYGGGNYGLSSNSAFVYINGTSDMEVSGDVFGGSNQKGGVTNGISVTYKNGVVKGNIYGGSNTQGIISGLAKITMSGGLVNNVYGGGYGSLTNMAGGTNVSIKAGNVSGNVYGGGELGSVTAGNTIVTLGNDYGGPEIGGSVFGAGKGGSISGTPCYALVSGTTAVTVNNGTVNGEVYGGGEAGNVIFGAMTTTYDFEDGSSQGWAVYDKDGDGKSWSVVDISDHSSYQAHGGTKSMKSSFSDSYLVENWLISPQIILGGEISFWVSRLNNSSYHDYYSVCVSTNSNSPDDFTNVLVASTEPGTTFSQVTCSLSSFSGMGYVAIVHTATLYDQAYIFVDDISITQPNEMPASTVTVNGGDIKGDVFGGGMLGTTTGGTVVTVTGGTLRQNLFGGAYGSQGTVYVAGQKNVGVMGGRIYGSVYGGSRLANDALTFTPGTFASSTETATSSIVNITGGQLEQHVYSAGYYGQAFGSVYTFIGLKAAEEAPNHNLAGVDFVKSKLIIKGSVWAGGDWGVFNGTFGGATVTGYSNIYIDGLGYATNDENTNNEYYMKLQSNIYGCGTSADAGKQKPYLFIKNYGELLTNGNDNTGGDIPYLASSSIESIQKFGDVILDNTHLSLTGQSRVNSLSMAEKYGVYEIDEAFYLANGSTLVLSSPADQVKSLHSITYTDEYLSSSTTVDEVTFSTLAGNSGNEYDNKLRLNDGCHFKIKYNDGTNNYYGQLRGYLHLMRSNGSNSSYVYARPKQSSDAGNQIATSPATLDNPLDGGFVCYKTEHNTFSAGTLTSSNVFATVNDAPGTVANGVQLPYENHAPSSKDDSQYFRIWRFSDNVTNIGVVLNAVADGTNAKYKTVEVEVSLPAWRSNGNIYRMLRGTDSNNNPISIIDYGNDVLTYNAACYDGSNWMYYNETKQKEFHGLTTTSNDTITKALSIINSNPDLNFGLSMYAGSGITHTTDYPDNHIICYDSDDYLARLNAPYSCAGDDFLETPTLKFRLTYSNHLTSNRALDPIVIPMVQIHKEGDVETSVEYVYISLSIVTSTDITLGTETKMYAIMDGTGGAKEKGILEITIPSFEVFTTGQESNFYLKKVKFDQQGNGGHTLVLNSNNTYEPGSYTDGVTYESSKTNSFNINNFGLTLKPVVSTTSTGTWRFASGELDGSPGNDSDLPNYTTDYKIGQNSGRNPVDVQLALYYNGNMDMGIRRAPMGTVTLTIEFDNYKYSTETDHKATFDIVVEVWRKGVPGQFYVDGVNGVIDAEEGRGKYPDYPAPTVNYILNRLDFLPGDNIYVINTLNVNNSTVWNGNKFQNKVNLYRYPGRHKTSLGAPDNANPAFTGELVNVGGSLSITGFKIDGMYTESKKHGNHNQYLYPTDGVYNCSFNGESVAPLFVVAAGGNVALGKFVVLQHNCNTQNDGGAIRVEYGGTLRMNSNAHIKENISSYGGGVFMDGALIVSDDVKIFNNSGEQPTIPDDYGTNTNVTLNFGGMQRNVWLAPIVNDGEDQRVVQIGNANNDGYGALTANAHIGIRKNDWDHSEDGYMPVVHAEVGTTEYLELPYQPPQSIITHDLNIYKLVEYNNPNYLYWTSTWVTAVTSEPTGFDKDQIDTPEELAWAISIVNGENGCAAAPNTNFTLTGDIDMSQNLWVPIGDEYNAYEGTFNGNGHTVTGLRTTLRETYMGMFGHTASTASIENVIAESSFRALSTYMGALVGLSEGKLNNVGAGGTLECLNNAANYMGGLVGTTASTSSIQNAYAAATMMGSTASVMGGLVGDNGSNLFNAYSNVTMTGGGAKGGLAGTHASGKTIANCYSVIGSQTFPAYAATNNGTIKICYTDKVSTETSDYVGSGTAAEATCGTYGAVKDRKAIGYLYDDNTVSATNDYVASTLTYVKENPGTENEKTTRIDKWPGLLSSLNQWVTANPENLSPAPTPWFRPTTKTINGDLPVLGFPDDNCLGTLDDDGKFLQYSAKGNKYTTPISGLDNLLNKLNDENIAASIFLYDTALDVARVPDPEVRVFINEDAVLLQTATAGAFINTTVGVTFDNSCKKATDYAGNKLLYDWHLLSTPLSNAKIGASYSHQEGGAYTPDLTHNYQNSPVDISAFVDSYFPNGLNLAMNATYFAGVTWDFYTYFEPEYHWINLKRNKNNHFHYEIKEGVDLGRDFQWDAYCAGKHYQIAYTGEDQDSNSAKDNECYFTPGKGYMMAISQDSYMSNTGTLNNGNVTIPVTKTIQNPNWENFFDQGANLVGNPYQAYLDLDAVSEGNSGFTAFFVYIAEQNQYKPYVYHQSINTETPSKYIHPHQAFFVQKTGDGSADFTFNSGMATATKEGHSYFRGEHIDYPLINLTVTNDNDAKNYTIIEVNRPEVGGAGKVETLNTTNFDLYAHFEQQDYKLLFTPLGEQRVAVFFKTDEDGTYTFTWNTQNGTFDYLRLIDNITGKECDMLTHDHYSFEGHAADYAARFYVMFHAPEQDEPEEQELFAFFDGSGWVVKGQGQLDLIDVTGRVLSSQYVNGIYNTVHYEQFAAGVYLLRLGDKTQKIVIN